MNELRLKADMHDENSPESRRALRYLTVFFVGGVVAVMDELERKAARDARALEMAERQLRPQPDRSPPALAATPQRNQPRGIARKKTACNYINERSYLYSSRTENRSNAAIGAMRPCATAPQRAWIDQPTGMH